jgi:hypothetical protein
MTLQGQKQDLLNLVTKLAASQLEHGGFIFPFGAVLGPGRHIKLIKPQSWKENPTRNEVEGYWARVLSKASSDTGGKLVCWCSVVDASWDEGDWKSCVLIHLEQAEALSEDMFYPYEQTEGCQVVFGLPTVVKTSPQVFGFSERVN